MVGALVTESRNSLRTGPASTTVTPTPVPRRSAARPAVKWVSPAFEAP